MTTGMMKSVSIADMRPQSTPTWPPIVRAIATGTVRVSVGEWAADYVVENAGWWLIRTTQLANRIHTFVEVVLVGRSVEQRTEGDLVHQRLEVPADRFEDAFLVDFAFGFVLLDVDAVLGFTFAPSLRKFKET